MGSNKENCHYLKPQKWLSGELCFWRNNSNYSKKTKAKLEKGLKEFDKYVTKQGKKYSNEI
jgi:hypothetical protein